MIHIKYTGNTATQHDIDFTNYLAEKFAFMIFHLA